MAVRIALQSAIDGHGANADAFNLRTDSSPANYGIAGAGFSVALPRRLQAFVYDEALVGYKDYRSNSVAVGVRGQF
jgi:hypothetical protein